MKITRRTFVKAGSYAAISAPFIHFGCTPPSTEEAISSETLYHLFLDPPGTARVFVRWWWNGDRLTEKEILRELDVMKAAGIGGVEINPIKFPSDADPMGIESIEWLSEDWISMLKVALEGAKKRGIICDMIVGSGWPFGGEFLTGTERTQLVAVQTRNLMGGRTYDFTRQSLLQEVEPHFHSSYEDKEKELLMIRLVPARMDVFDPGMDLNSLIHDENLRIDVPEGEYVLYWLVKITGFQAVINGAPGAMGPVLNHYNKQAVEKYLKRLSEKLQPAIGPLGEHFRAMFCDSLELEGANWSDDLFVEFEKRRVYDLKPYFPFILFKIGHMGNPEAEEYGASLSSKVLEIIQNVRYDFETTRVELFRERFVEPFTEWCRNNGVQARAQAYGRGYHPLESSMLIDIPECETWMSKTVGELFDEKAGLAHYRNGRAYTMINKFVSSGARLAGKKVISCEEITNTSMVFNATLERIKIAGDQSNLSGVTHSVLHGFNYSPPEAPFPGWIRYGTYFNERNTWWPFFRYWSDYKARLSVVFQNSDLVSDVAVMHPIADMWAQFGSQRDPFPTLLYPSYQHQVWEAIHQNGNGCDYVSENIIRDTVIEDGRLVYATRSYPVLIMLEVDSMLPDTASKLVKFVSGGGKLVMVGKVPSRTPGLAGNESAPGSIEASMRDIIKKYPERAAVVAAPQSDLSGWYRTIQEQFDLKPYIKFESPSTSVSQVYYRTGELDIFFISNSNIDASFSQKVEFAVPEGRTGWSWDPETGERFIYPVENGHNKLMVDLEPATARLIVFEKNSRGKGMPVKSSVPMKETEVNGPWKVMLNHVNGQRHVLLKEALMDMSKDEELRSFAGKIHYENLMDVPTVNKKTLLDLGKVHGVSELTVNGKKVGERWYGKHVYDISNAIKQGENTLQITVTTTVGNYLKSTKENPVGQRWTRGQPYYPLGLLGPVHILQ